MSLLEVTQDVGDLLLYHVSPVLFVGLGVPETPCVHPVGHVGPHAPFTVTPQVAMGISVPP